MIALRDPNQILKLAHMGQSFPTRLSFLRVLFRRLTAEGAELARVKWDINPDGFGHAVYELRMADQVYSLFAVTQPLADADRTDRVIATAWDGAFVLYDGVLDDAECARLAANAPRQEAGRFGPRDLVLSRANKSGRAFGHAVAALRGEVPLDRELLQKIGYLMRTTAVYGNGKFGIADRAMIDTRPGLEGPFMAEMLCVWMIREFVIDLVEHIGGAALPDDLRRYLGIGNATGLGMAPFLASHPCLLDAWLHAREAAVQDVRQSVFQPGQQDQLVELALRITQHLAEWDVPDPGAAAELDQLRRDWDAFCGDLPRFKTPEALHKASAQAGPAMEELALSLLLETRPDLVDGYSDCLATPHAPALQPDMGLAAICALVEDHFPEALKIDFINPENQAQFWYISEDKLEPRIGQRFAEDGAELETPLDIARRIQRFYHDAQGETGQLWQFLLKYPDHYFAALRVQNLGLRPYAEVRDNMISAATRPIDLLRFKLAFFGAVKFDPKSDRWTRVTLCQGAPRASDLAAGDADRGIWMPALS